MMTVVLSEKVLWKRHGEGFKPRYSVILDLGLSLSKELENLFNPLLRDYGERQIQASDS